jgi:Reverse transcriptase (RNA-dependent DNA polymerase)
MEDARLEQSLGSRIVTYADDLVILCRNGKAEEALLHLRKLMGKLKLTVNEEKTRICKVPEGEFNFLGYSFGRMYTDMFDLQKPRHISTLLIFCLVRIAVDGGLSAERLSKGAGGENHSGGVRAHHHDEAFDLY